MAPGAGVILGLPALPRECLPDEIGHHLPSRALLASCALLHGEQNVIVDSQRGAHASDATASPPTSRFVPSLATLRSPPHAPTLLSLDRRPLHARTPVAQPDELAGFVIREPGALWKAGAAVADELKADRAGGHA